RADDGIRDLHVTGVQTCALPISPTHTVIAPSGEQPPKLTDARRRVMEEAAKEQVSAAELARRAETSSAVVKGLVDCGALVKLEISEDPPFPNPDLTRTGKNLSAIQLAAAEKLCASVRDRKFHVALLDGVTGSGKTEVYLEAAAEALKEAPNAQVLVLLPEIALTQAAMN